MRMDPKQLRIYAVTDKSWLKPGETLEQVVEELLKAGVTCVQLRDKTADDGLLLKEAETLNALCRQYEVPLIINDRPDIAEKSRGSRGACGTFRYGNCRGQKDSWTGIYYRRKCPQPGRSTGGRKSRGRLFGMRRGFWKPYKGRRRLSSQGTPYRHLRGRFTFRQ